MGVNMGLGILANRCPKFKNRFRFKISGVIDTEVNAFETNILPPFKSARPSISFGEEKIEHLSETINFPTKPEWQPLEVTLYDMLPAGKYNPMFIWLASYYDPKSEEFAFIKKPTKSHGNYGLNVFTTNFKAIQAEINMLDGCGNTMETWVYEGVYPQKIDWGDLDMSQSEIITVAVSFRYDRAYQSM